MSLLKRSFGINSNLANIIQLQLRVCSIILDKITKYILKYKKEKVIKKSIYLSSSKSFSRGSSNSRSSG